MTTAILAACALACPLMMLGMMWMMRGQRRSRRSNGNKE
jgi:hypothetical protein